MALAQRQQIRRRLARQRGRAENKHRVFRLGQHFGQWMFARGDIGQHARIVAQRFVKIGQICRGAGMIDFKPAAQPCLADTRIDQRRFDARVSTDNQANIGLLDPGDGGIKQIVRALRKIGIGAFLAAIALGDVEHYPAHRAAP